MPTIAKVESKGTIRKDKNQAEYQIDDKGVDISVPHEKITGVLVSPLKNTAKSLFSSSEPNQEKGFEEKTEPEQETGHEEKGNLEQETRHEEKAEPKQETRHEEKAEPKQETRHEEKAEPEKGHEEKINAANSHESIDYKSQNTKLDTETMEPCTNKDSKLFNENGFNFFNENGFNLFVCAIDNYNSIASAIILLINKGDINLENGLRTVFVVTIINIFWKKSNLPFQKDVEAGGKVIFQSYKNLFY